MNRLEAIEKCEEVIKHSGAKMESANQGFCLAACKYVMTRLYEEGLELVKVRAEDGSKS